MYWAGAHGRLEGNRERHERGPRFHAVNQLYRTKTKWMFRRQLDGPVVPMILTIWLILAIGIAIITFGWQS